MTAPDLRQALLAKDFATAAKIARPEAFIMYEDMSSPLSLACQANQMDLVEMFLELIPEKYYRLMVCRAMRMPAIEQEIKNLLRWKLNIFNDERCLHCDEMINGSCGANRRYCSGCCCDDCLHG